MAFALTVATTHTKTLVSPDSGSEDKVYGSDYVSASSHTSSPTVSGGVAGGLLWTDSTTSISVSALLAANALVIGGGAGAAPFTDGTNLLYTTASGPRLQVGSGSTTSAGFVFGYNAESGFSNGWGTAVGTLSGSNYWVKVGADRTILAAPASGTLYFNIGNGNKALLSPTVGAGFSITAGVATSDVNALSTTQTWNAAGVTFTHEKHVITDTASAAGSLALQYLGGASGTTNLLSVSKAGVLSIPNGSKTAPAITGLSSGQGAVSGVFFHGFQNKGTGFASNGVAVVYINATTGIEAVEAFGFTAENNSGSKVLDTNTAPSIASGFGTSPSISSNNGTAAFTLTIGTSTTGITTGTITMPAATTGWVCSCQNVTNPASFIVGQTGGSTTTITLTNYSRTTGLATDFTASDVIRIMARGY